MVKAVQYHPDTLQVLTKDTTYLKFSKKQKSYLQALGKEKLGQYRKVDSIITNALSSLDFSNDSNLYMDYLSLLAEQKKITDDFESSVKLNYKVLSYHMNQRDTLRMVKSHIAFGELYRATENFALGLSYLEKGEVLLNEYAKDPPLELYCGVYNRRAAILLQIGKELDSVEVLSKKVIRMANEIGDNDLEATSCNELGFLYLNLGNPEAKKYLHRAIKLWDKMGYDIYAANARLNLAQFYNNTEEYTCYHPRSTWRSISKSFYFNRKRKVRFFKESKEKSVRKFFYRTFYFPPIYTS